MMLGVVVRAIHPTRRPDRVTFIATSVAVAGRRVFPRPRAWLATSAGRTRACGSGTGCTRGRLRKRWPVPSKISKTLPHGSMYIIRLMTGDVKFLVWFFCARPAGSFIPLSGGCSNLVSCLAPASADAGPAPAFESYTEAPRASSAEQMKKRPCGAFSFAPSGART